MKLSIFLPYIGLFLGSFDTIGIQLKSFSKFFFPQCEYRATHEGNLAHHMEQVHEGAKYECNYCEYIGTPEGNLACHIQSVYEGARYECR